MPTLHLLRPVACAGRVPPCRAPGRRRSSSASGQTRAPGRRERRAGSSRRERPTSLISRGPGSASAAIVTSTTAMLESEAQAGRLTHSPILVLDASAMHLQRGLVSSLPPSWLSFFLGDLAPLQLPQLLPQQRQLPGCPASGSTRPPWRRRPRR